MAAMNLPPIEAKAPDVGSGHGYFGGNGRRVRFDNNDYINAGDINDDLNGEEIWSFQMFFNDHNQREAVDFWEQFSGAPAFYLDDEHHDVWLHPDVAHMFLQWQSPTYNAASAMWYNEWKNTDLSGDCDEKVITAITHRKISEKRPYGPSSPNQLATNVASDTFNNTRVGNTIYGVDQTMVVGDLSKWADVLGRVVAARDMDPAHRIIAMLVIGNNQGFNIKNISSHFHEVGAEVTFH